MTNLEILIIESGLKFMYKGVDIYPSIVSVSYHDIDILFHNILHMDQMLITTRTAL